MEKDCSFKEPGFWHSLSLRADYWLTDFSQRIFDNPGIASFINDVEIKAEGIRLNRQPNRLEVWLDRQLDRLLQTSFMNELSNEIEIRTIRRNQEINRWATDHNKKPL